MRVFKRKAERVIHQDCVRHGGIDGAETVFAIESLGHECLSRGDGVAAQRCREERLDALEQPVDSAEDLHAQPRLMRALWPFADSFGRRDEQLLNRNPARVDGARFQRLQDKQRDHYGPRPIRDLVEMERKPSRQKHDLDRHGRNAAPRNGAVKRQQEPREDVALAAPPFAKIASRARRICGASGSSPIILSAK